MNYEAFPGPMVARNNTIIGNGTQWRGLWSDYASPSGTLFEGNHVENTIRCYFAEGTDNAIFRNNTCKNITTAGVEWGGVPAGSASTGGQITGNTFVGPEPQNGWIVIRSGSIATVRNNSFLP